MCTLNNFTPLTNKNNWNGFLANSNNWKGTRLNVQREYMYLFDVPWTCDHPYMTAANIFEANKLIVVATLENILKEVIITQTCVDGSFSKLES